MKITLAHANGKTYAGRTPYLNAPFAVIANAPPCKCGEDEVRVYSKSPTINHDKVTGDAFCRYCDAPAGRLTAKVETIFGIEEDQNVLNGRCRVY